MTDATPHAERPTAAGAPWRLYESLPSTNDVAREWLADGAPDGAAVSATRQTAGRGRQGRSWEAPEGALALSVIVRSVVDGLLSLRAGLAVAQVAGSSARIKWPNDVLIDGRKVAGILVELVDGAAIVGIGVNVAVDVDALPADVAERAGSLGLPAAEVEPLAERLLAAFDAALALSPADVLAQLAARDALTGRAVRWSGGEGVAEGVDEAGRLLVRGDDGEQQALDAGEVHLL